MGKRGTCRVEVTIAEDIIKKVSSLDIGELLLIDISSDGRGGTTKNCMNSSTVE